LDTDREQVAAARQKLEVELTAQLEDMKERLPDLMVYQRIYKNEDLGRKIAAVYKGIVHFSREATRYFVENHGISKIPSKRDDRQLMS